MLAAALSGCASSAPSNRAPALRLTNLPASVDAEIVRVTPLPKGDLPGGKVSDRRMMEFAAELRRSELRKVRALKAAKAAHTKQRKALAARAKGKAD